MVSSTDKQLSQSAIERIEAALRLANHANTSREEAEAALLAAQRLCAKYHVELSEFELSEQVVEEDVVHLETAIFKSYMEWKVNLASVLAANFRCRVYLRNGHFSDAKNTKRIAVVVVGLKTDAEILKRTMMYAIEIGERICREYTLHHYYKVARHTVSEGLALRRSWLTGYVDGIRAKYRDQVASNTGGAALMVVMPQSVTDEMAKMFLHKNNRKLASVNTNNHAYSNGYQTGRGADRFLNS